ncbi:MAG: branched-chain amino acid ABC transporter permease [Anaerolineales bacterium]
MVTAIRQRLAYRFSWVGLLLWVLRIGVVVLIIVGSVNTLTSQKYTLENWVSLFFSGLAQGSIYALIALGYTMVYGILLMINFAHGEVYMAGAFTAYFVAAATARSGLLDSNPWASIGIWLLVSISVSTLVAVLLERVAYRPLRNAPRLVPLITAIGASLFLQYTFRGLYGSSFRSYPEVAVLRGTVTILGVGVPIVQIFVILAAVVLMLALNTFVERTKTGKSMRAVSEDKEIAGLMGIDVNRVIVTTFAIGGMLAGAAGIFRGLYQPQGISAFMGFLPGLKAFTAAVLGGIGSIPGAVLGGMVLGLFESFGPNLILEGLGIEGANQLRDAIAIVLLVLVLIFRPQGIMGEKLSEEKA